MCLTIDANLSERNAKKFMREGTETITVYKLVLPDKLVVSPKFRFKSPYNHYLWTKLGWVKAKGKRQDGPWTIWGGAFHAYQTKKIALDYMYYGEAVFELEVKVQDIIAYGDVGDIAFTKCRVTRAAVNSVLKNINLSY